MKKVYTVVLYSLLFSFIAHAQNDSIHYFDEGILEDQVFFSEKVGWTIKIPDGWPLVSLEKQQQIEQKGLDAMKRIVDFEIDASQLKNLISFQKDRFNAFSSSIEPFVLEYEGEYEENNAELKDLLVLTYKSQGISTEVTETSHITIDGITFETYDIRLYTPAGDLFLNQLMYNTLINGFDFGVCINYNNETDKKTMVDAFKNSTFIKQETKSISELKILYLINGVEMPEAIIKNLDTNAIETVTVIKNKDHIANYTSEDYEGVIIIELKKKSKN